MEQKDCQTGGHAETEKQQHAADTPPFPVPQQLTITYRHAEISTELTDKLTLSSSSTWHDHNAVFELSIK